jgi:hypothetical protein
MNSQKKLDKILFAFNRQLSKIIKMADQVDPNNADIDWIRRMLRILRDDSPSLVLEKCIDKFCDNSEQIIARDTDFFVTKHNFDEDVDENDNKEWVVGIINMIKEKQALLLPDQLSCMWDCLNKMLECIVQYRIITGDFAP